MGRHLRDGRDSRDSRKRLSSPSEADPLIGRTVDHYHILGHLGGGGMGVVYRAEDTRLQRTVALKFLPPAMTRDPVAKSRFLQEARAASALDHPNVCTIYDIGETDDGQLYLAMPAYDGETLKKRVERGPLPIEEAVDIAKQVAMGLAKAHRQGIVHRDIKPANLMITSDGIVKILDFGLAKLAGAAGLTRAGFCVGTPSHMSPEQARGEVDHRTDLWSLGVVLYEMLTGLLPFQAESDPATVHAVLHDEPQPLRHWRQDAPAALERIVIGLLKKNLADRYPSADNVLSDLRALGGPPTSGRASTEIRRRPGRRIGWAAGLLLALAAGGLTLREMREEAPVQSEDRRLTGERGSERQPSLSPVGGFVAYVKRDGGDADIFWQRIDGDNPLLLTENCPLDDTDPAVSPDGTQIAFRSDCGGGGIFLMGATGESPRRLLASGYSPAWSPDGAALVVATIGTSDPGVRPVGSELRLVTVPDGHVRTLVSNGDAAQPSWSPGGARIAYSGTQASNGYRDLWTVGRDGRDPRPLLKDGKLDWSPVWSGDGRYLYFLSDRGGSRNIWRVRIEESSGKVLGEPEPLRAPSESIASLSLAGDRIVYATDDSRSNVERVAFDPQRGAVAGPSEPLTQRSWHVQSADVSPDGRWVVFDTAKSPQDLYVVPSDPREGRDGNDRLRRLTDDVHNDRIPRWSRDGRWIYFYSNRGGKYEAWRIRPDGGGPEQLTALEGPVYTPLPSPVDDLRLVYSTEALGSAMVDLRDPLERRTPRPLPIRAGQQPFSADSWSADGRTLAGYTSVPGIFLYSFGSNRVERLTRRGSDVAWLHGSPRLLYLDQGRLFLADVASRVSRELLAPPASSSFRRVSVSKDDRTLFLIRHEDEGDLWMLTIQ